MTHRLTAPSATFHGNFRPGDSEVRSMRSRSIAPSEIAAVLGHSPHETREDLRLRKITNASRPPMLQPDQTGLTWDKQPELAAAFERDHPQYRVIRTGYWCNNERPWQRCWPHRVLIDADANPDAGPVPIVATLTFRTMPYPLDTKGWGPDGSDEVPLADFHHHTWLIDALGVDYGYVVAYSGLENETRTYRVGRNLTHIGYLRESAWSFLESVCEARS